MPFGYIPHPDIKKNLFFRLFGNPNLIRRMQSPVIMKMLAIEEDDVILDAGCGKWFFTYEIAKKPCKLYVGIDRNPGLDLSFAMRCLPNVSYVKGDVQELPFISAKFNKILLSSVLQMVVNDRILISECYRVLKNNGILVLSIPTNYVFIKKLNSKRTELNKKFGVLGKGHYSKYEVIKLLQNEGFEILDVEYSPKAWGSLIYEMLLYAWNRFGFPSFNPIMFLLVYPLAYFDRFFNHSQKGNELIIKARKIT